MTNKREETMIKRQLEEQSKREEMKIKRQLEELRWKRPEVYDVIIEASLLPEDKFEEFMRQVSPILKKYMN